MSNIDQISRLRKISISDFLTWASVPTARQHGKEIYYHSPFRSENTPSFCVNTIKNVWYDHGEGCGGDILDLVMKVLNVDLQTAIKMLEQNSGNISTPKPAPTQVPDPAKEKTAKHTMAITKVEEFEKNQVLVNYLKGRGIKVELLLTSGQTMKHLKAISYSVSGKEKEYFALGWMNNEGGWELRSRNFTGFIGKEKTYTFLPAPRDGKPGIAIFESFIDYFSALTYYNVTNLKKNVLILNSTNLAKKTLHLVNGQSHFDFYLDNDEAGIRALNWYSRNAPNVPGTNYSNLYADYKDFNDLLTNTLPKKPLPNPNEKHSQVSQKARWWLWVAFQKEDPVTKKNKQCTFFSWNNHQTGYEHLLYLRAHGLYDAKLSRLCERTKGREFKIIDEQWH